MHRKGGSIVEFNRGPVGTIVVSEDPHSWTVEFVHAHFHSRDPIIGNAIAREYSSWRHRTLGAVFWRAKRKKVGAVNLAISTKEGESELQLLPAWPAKELEERNAKAAAEIKSEIARRKVFIEIAEQNRFNVSKEGKMLVAVKSGK